MIRNFIYLDSGKLRSLSSQLFHGVTEQVVSLQSDSQTNTEEQKGPVASGRILADIFSRESSSSELKFLEDHAYTIFEDKLIKDELIDVFNSSSTSANLNRNFVKVTARLQINDLSRSATILKGFNSIGEAFWRVSNEEMLLTKNNQKITPDSEARKKAGEQGMQMHQKVAEAAASLIEFGFQDLLEANIAAGGKAFSGPLKRDSLREEESMLIHKYSRTTQGEFTMVGVVTNRGDRIGNASPPPDVKDANGIKQALRYFANHLQTLEDNFAAPLANEVVLDPIAVYSAI